MRLEAKGRDKKELQEIIDSYEIYSFELVIVGDSVKVKNNCEGITEHSLTTNVKIELSEEMKDSLDEIKNLIEKENTK